MSKEYKDRFTESENELQEKNAYICVSCNKSYPKNEAEKRAMSCCGRTLRQLNAESYGP